MRFCSSDLAAAAALDVIGRFIVRGEASMPDFRDEWRSVPCAPARSPRPAGAIRCRRQQQIERRAGGGWLNIEATADDCRAMPHARDAAARAFAAESCAVVAHLDADLLAGFIQSGLDAYAGRAGVRHDVGEGLRQVRRISRTFCGVRHVSLGTSLTCQSRSMLCLRRRSSSR